MIKRIVYDWGWDIIKSISFLWEELKWVECLVMLE